MKCPHGVKHRNPNHKHYSCQFCDFIFCSALNLASHAIKRHDGKVKLPVLGWKYISTKCQKYTMPTTTIKVENSTLESFRQKRIEYEYKKKIIIKNDDEYLKILLEKKQWKQKMKQWIYPKF